MRDDAAAEGVVAAVIRRPDRIRQNRIDLGGQLRRLRRVFEDGRKHEAQRCVSTGAAEQSRRGRSPFADLEHPRVCAALQKLVVPRVDHEQVRLVGGQLLHQRGDPVAGVADSAGIDHFPVPARVGRRKVGPQPAAERSAVVVGPAVRGRAADAENAVRVRRLRVREPLPVEPAVFVRRGDSFAAFCDKQRKVGRKADKRVSVAGRRADPQQRQGRLQTNEKPRGGGKSEAGPLRSAKLRRRRQTVNPSATAIRAADTRYTRLGKSIMRATRRRFLTTSAAFSVAPAFSSKSDRPNIVFAISDDQSYAHTGAFGDPVARTPTLRPQ